MGRKTGRDLKKRRQKQSIKKKLRKQVKLQKRTKA
jgi:hypothetical protein